ncbi:MAG: hypothetical protein ACW9XH_06460 [Candidatus Nitrosopumilus sp. bin_32a]
MVVVGDLIEIVDKVSDNGKEIKDLEKIPWIIQSESKIPIEIFSLYSINSETVTINDVHSETFDQIKKSEFSHVFVHVDQYEEMFILFFEFAVETIADNFEFVHFGIVPTNDFFNTLNSNPILKIRTKNFKFSESAMGRILEKLSEFNSKYPKNLQF